MQNTKKKTLELVVVTSSCLDKNYIFQTTHFNNTVFFKLID